jgi:hypothetical protein
MPGVARPPAGAQCTARGGRLFRGSGRIQRRLQARRRDRGEEEAVGLNNRVASAAVRGSIAPESHDRDGHSHPCCSAFVPTRGARASETQRVVRGPGSTCRARPAEWRAHAAEPPAFRSRGDASTSWSTDEPMVGARGRVTSPRPWWAPRCCSMVAVCLRPPDLTAPVADPRLNPPLWTLLASSTSAPAMSSTRHTSSPWPAGRPDQRPRSLLPSPVPRLPWMRSHVQLTRCAASSSASALIRVLLHVGDRATAPASFTSASL